MNKETDAPEIEIEIASPVEVNPIENPEVELFPSKWPENAPLPEPKA